MRQSPRHFKPLKKSAFRWAGRPLMKAGSLADLKTAIQNDRLRKAFRDPGPWNDLVTLASRLHEAIIYDEDDTGRTGTEYTGRLRFFINNIGTNRPEAERVFRETPCFDQHFFAFMRQTGTGPGFNPGSELAEIVLAQPAEALAAIGRAVENWLAEEAEKKIDRRTKHFREWQSQHPYITPAPEGPDRPGRPRQFAPAALIISEVARWAETHKKRLDIISRQNPRGFALDELIFLAILETGLDVLADGKKITRREVQKRLSDIKPRR